MSDRFDTDYLEVGDSFEGGAIEQSYFISAVMEAGGEVEIDGDIVRILQLPKKETPKAKAPVYEEPVEKVEKAPEPVKEEPPLVDLASEEPVIEKPKVISKPITKPGPKPKTLVTTKKTEA